MLLNQLISELNKLAPEDTAIDDDTVGLLIEPKSGDISDVVVCLDATSNVVEVAVRQQANLIIAHHPLIYHPIKRLTRHDPINCVVFQLVEAGIGLYAMHTNWDLAEGGINDTLAGLFNLSDIRPLGNSPMTSIPRIGRLPFPQDANQFIEYVGKTLNCCQTNALRATNLLRDKTISTVCVCGGAGAELVPEAIAAGADAYITGDVRHHEFIDAYSRGLLLIDAGHEATEAPGMSKLAKLIQEQYPTLKSSFIPNWQAIAA